MPKNMDFEGSGHKGAGFEQKGYSERNLQSLLMTLGSSGKAQEAIKDLSKIDKNQWIGIATHMDFLGSLVGITGTDFDVLSGIRDTLKDVITTEINAALTPLKNEIIGVINTLLEPFMPYITEAVNELSSYMGTSINFWEALLTGKLDDFARENIELANKLREDWWASGEGQRAAWNRWGIDLRQLDEQGTAGGVYSGQFDIDPDALARAIEDQGTGGYDG